jgi:hypothetical protein
MMDILLRITALNSFGWLAFFWLLRESNLPAELSDTPVT